MARCCAGNEPDLLAAWQFNFAGNDYANYTQYWTRKMLDIKYSTTADVRRVETVPREYLRAACPTLSVYPHVPRLHAVVSQGLPGNDDFGTMSAWEVWAYMGLYPLTGSRRAWRCCVTHTRSPSVSQQVQANSPATSPPCHADAGFSIGAPAFPSVNVTLPASLAQETLGVEPSVDGAAGTTVLSVVAHGASPTAVYVRNATCNGVALASPFVTWDQLVNDGKVGCCMRVLVRTWRCGERTGV